MPRMIAKQNKALKLLHRLCSHGALSAFLSSATRYPVSSPKTDKAILPKSEKWWEMTSCDSQAVLSAHWFMSMTQSGPQSKLGPAFYHLSPSTNWKQNIYSNLTIYSEVIQVPILAPVSFFSHKVIQEGQIESFLWHCCPETNLHYKLGGDTECIHTYSINICTAARHTLHGHFSYHDIKMRNHSSSIEHLAEFACKSQRGATFSHCSPLNGLMIVNISTACEAAAF